jgi:uncharacterized protein
MGKVLLTGGSGFIGQKLAEALINRGDKVTILTRDPIRAQRKLPQGARAVAWDPTREGPWFEEVEAANAIVHLAGESVGQRWTPEVKRSIEDSRVIPTRLVVDAIRKAKQKPSTFVSASAIGIYGPRPAHEQLDESARRGDGFLADVVERWESEARRAEEHGVRTVMLRIGIVLGEGGGPLEKMILPFKLFAGGPIGDGKQIVSWVHSDDVVGLVLLALDNEEARGPINTVAPNAVSGRELAQEIGRAMHRPSWFRTPKAVIGLAMGKEAAEAVTSGQRVVPRKAVELGYTFKYPDIGPALGSILGR